MKNGRFIGMLTPLVAVGGLVAPGTYVMVYLYRWEWNRAIVSGIFFIAAEIGVIAALLFSRLSRLEARLEDRAAPARQSDATSPGPPAADTRRESPFAWLDPAEPRMGVFVPILMGAGVILSAVAFVVEKISGAMAKKHRPAGEVVAGNRAHHPYLVIGAGVMAAVSVFLLADATQTRPDPEPDRVTIELDVWVRDRPGGAAERANALAASCRSRSGYESIQVTGDGDDFAHVSLTAVLGEHARRRLTGCLGDITLDGVKAQVVAISTQPAAVRPAPVDAVEPAPAEAHGRQVA